VQRVVFKNANDYFTEVTDILAQFDCTMDEIDLLRAVLNEMSPPWRQPPWRPPPSRPIFLS